MKTSTFLLLASFLVASSFLSTSGSSIDLSTPIAAWSTGTAPGAGSPAVLSNTVGLAQLSHSLVSLLELGSSSSSSPSLFASFDSTPELAVFFVEPTLTTHAFYQLTGAFDATAATRPAFAGVRRLMESKQSLLLENVELQTDLLGVVGALATRQLSAHITSTVVLVGDDHEDELSQALLAAFPQRVRHVATADLTAFLRSHASLCTNGVTDIIVQRFDDRSPLAEHDAAIAATTAVLDSMSSDVVFFLGSQESPEISFDTAAPPRYVHTAEPTEPTTPAIIYNSLFPPGIVSGLITAVFLVIVLLIGFCCLCYSQTPDRFPEAIREGQVNHHMLYPSKQ